MNKKLNSSFTMEQKEIDIYSKIIENYFEELTQEKATILKPFKKENNCEVLDYTSIIGISGVKQGSMYITASKDLIIDISKIFLGVDETTSQEEKDELLSDEILYDMAGELSNNITGNLRKHFGSDFNISIPNIITGKVKDIAFNSHIEVMCFPFNWKTHKAYFVIGLKNK